MAQERQEPRKRILFLCTGNSCRSQMAEGWVRALKADLFEAYSAGVEKRGLDPRAVRAMAEAGVDVSGQRSKTVDELLDELGPQLGPDASFDYVVTLCGHAQENCPYLPGRFKRLHVGFDDPPALAAGAKTEDEAMAPYRRVRDEIRAFVEAMPGSLEP